MKQIIYNNICMGVDIPAHVCIFAYMYINMCCVRMHICMHAGMDGWLDGWMDGWMDGCTSLCTCLNYATSGQKDIDVSSACARRGGCKALDAPKFHSCLGMLGGNMDFRFQHRFEGFTPEK